MTKNIKKKKKYYIFNYVYKYRQMEINLFGYRISLEVLILIGVVYLIMVGHTMCGCTNMPLLVETFSDMASGKNTKMVAVTKKEGFTGANTNNGQSLPYSLGDNSKVDTSTWGSPDLTMTPGKAQSPAVMAILNRPEQPVPLPEGEMLMFANTQFKPSCCPNTYSTSGGCACMTTAQLNHLTSRGGNNVPYSEY